MVSILVLGLLGLMMTSYSEAGVSFIRWGRTVCPAGSTRLYKGYMSGPNPSGGGSGSNYICLHENPKFVRPVPERQEWTGIAFGMEIEIVGAMSSVFKTDNIPGGVLHNQGMPCVQCYVQASTDKFVLHGRPDCGESGYELQYSGFLVSEAKVDRKRAEYVCLDEAPEGIAGGSGDDRQGQIYPVEVGCGSLPCNPYVDGYEVTCAVCTY